MEKTIKNVAGLLLAGVVAISCNSNDYSPVESSSDTAIVAKDHTAIAAMDTSGANKMTVDTVSMSLKKDTLPMKVTQVGKKHAKIVIVLPKLQSNAAMAADTEGAYNNVEVWPSYPGGQKALEDFFMSNVEYPQQATDNNTEGLVNINFIVDENGKVSSPKVTGTKIGDGLEDEALRVFGKMPKWNPGKIKGKNVKTRFTLPVRFQLES
jgi:protein TonB